MRLTFARGAQRDPDGIIGYTRRLWSEAQALAYVRDLRAELLKLLDHPELGPAVVFGRPGTRKWAHARHVAYYRIAAGSIRIVPILHASQDAEALLR